jgi:hypothetical protein
MPSGPRYISPITNKEIGPRAALTAGGRGTRNWRFRIHDEISRTDVNEEERVEAAIIGLLLDATVVGPWSVEELTRELGDPLAVGDAVGSLHAVGLIHRSGDLIFPTRAAIRAHRIIR